MSSTPKTQTDMQLADAARTPMSNSTHTIDDNLSRSGFTVVGKIDLKLIENVKRHLESSTVKQRHSRHTELD